MTGAAHGKGVLVVAAVIEREGRILIGQRKRGDWHEYRWEFPGGKVEPGEDPRGAVVRELAEELGIAAEAGEELTRYQHQYAGKPPIQIIFFRVTRFEGEPENLAFEQIRWENAARLGDYDFLDGDLDFIRRLTRGEFGRVL
jgi:8-oxo-dGTP diphosphatase